MEVVGVADELRDDLAEAERHDREVVPAQAQRRQADEDAGERGQAPATDEHEPHVDVDPLQRPVEMPTEPRWNFTCWNCPDASQPAVYAPTA